MARIVCRLETASEIINGIRFKRETVNGHPAMVSEDVPAEVAKGFTGIGGFHIELSDSDVEAPSASLAPQFDPSHVEIKGPKGVLRVAGDYSTEDLAALKQHWEAGIITPPGPPALPAPPPAEPSEAPPADDKKSKGAAKP